MPVAHHPSAAIRKHKFRGRGQKCLELCLDRLGNQPTRTGSQNFSERIVDCPFLSKGNNSILSHGVTLLLGGSGGLITNPVTPPSSHRHPVSSIAPVRSPTSVAGSHCFHPPPGRIRVPTDLLEATTAQSRCCV